MMVDNILDEFRWRGLVYDETEGLKEMVEKGPITVYNGFDPTGSSLHVGHLVPMMQLARWQKFGHTPIALAGGGTGMIGDPSGRSAERPLLSAADIEANLTTIEAQLAAILDFEAQDNPARVVNNADWLLELNLVAFLRDIGKHFTVNYMLAKDSVKTRMESGLSFTEFSYMLLQSYDFLHLFDNDNCTVQTGGSDQWGNIVAGVELIRRVRGEQAAAMVYPLLLRADGTKFGKTADGESVWLDPEQTSPYRFYQFWYNTTDADVIKYLKYFTWLDEAEIGELAEAVEQRPEQREAQRRLAREVTAMVHGPAAVAKAEQAAQVLFGGDMEGMDANDIADIFADVPSSELALSDLAGDGLLLAELLANSGLANGKGEARRDIKGGGVYLNNVRVEDERAVVATDDVIDGRFLILRKGKRRFHLVRVS